ncbi:GHKL domain-containing protein [Clostridiaceae bacterium NSJ-31]|uniref:GHKL domain-containing protein n=2 Tax=Ligaoa zhengdingensis TaxID=2763658 RepID=A0A926HZY0_9FIRM|nr:GHKL domain-containing protein [Ligaoa zhengdingensis]MBC8546407.1 GHKL domain-containing protein [Ligaoa zhengdingensis]
MSSYFAAAFCLQCVLSAGWPGCLRAVWGTRFPGALIFAARYLACLLGALGVCLLAMAPVFQMLRELKAQNERLQELQRLQEEHGRAMGEHQEAVRRMHHEIANHIETIQALIELGGNAEGYADRVLEEYRAFRAVEYCGHPVVDAVLYNRALRAQQQDTELELALELSAELPFEPVHLMSIFSNLLDNALEACSALPRGRWVRLRAALEKGGLSLIVENSCPEGAPCGGEGETTKADPFSHGMGLRIVRETVAEYGGSLLCRREGGVFRAVAFLPLATAAGDGKGTDTAT